METAVEKVVEKGQNTTQSAHQTVMQSEFHYEFVQISISMVLQVLSDDVGWLIQKGFNTQCIA